MDCLVQDTIRQMDVTNIWSQPLSEIRIDWDAPALDRPLGNQSTCCNLRDEQGSSSAGSHSFFSVTTRWLFHRQMRFLVCSLYLLPSSKSICHTVVYLVARPAECLEGCWACRDFCLGWQAVYSLTDVAKSSFSCSWDVFLHFSMPVNQHLEKLGAKSSLPGIRELRDPPSLNS